MQDGQDTAFAVRYHQAAQGAKNRSYGQASCGPNESKKSRVTHWRVIVLIHDPLGAGGIGRSCAGLVMTALTGAGHT